MGASLLLKSMRKGEPKTSLGPTSKGIQQKIARGPELPHATSTPIGTLPKGYPAPIHSPVAFEPFLGQSNRKKKTGEAELFEPSLQTMFAVQREISGWETYRYTL
jgi:hypothetical protein